MQQLMYQSVISKRGVVDEFRMEENHNLAGAHPKSSTALQFIMVHLESSYAHSPFSRIFV
tara:strand:+ start:200 stop:379 length:180 start_codon:yes stop_codon:yes gene_type:complete